MPINIVRAEIEDLEWILSQLKLFARFYGSKKSLYGDEEYARAALTNMMKEHIFFIAKQGSACLGLIAGYITAHPFNPTIRLLSEAFWWVEERYRGTRAGLLLLNAFTEYGRENADWITFALEDHSPVKETCLTKRGFVLQERSYLKEVGV